MFCVLVCIVIAAIMTVSTCAAKMTVELKDANNNFFGHGFLNSFTGSSYAETVADASGNTYVYVALYINNSFITEKLNTGATYTTSWVNYAGSGSFVSGTHEIYRNGVYYQGYTYVNP